MDWRSESWMFNDPCEACGVCLLDHAPSQMRHRYRSAIFPAEAFYGCEIWDIVNDTTAGTVERSITRHSEQQLSNQYSAPLPSREDRKRIRETAGPNQEDMADELRFELDCHSMEEPSGIPGWQAPPMARTRGGLAEELLRPAPSTRLRRTGEPLT